MRFSLSKDGKSINLIAAWLVLTIFAITVSVITFNLRDLYKLADHGVVTSGKIDAKLYDDHKLLSYSFRVGDTDYHGRGLPSYLGKEFSEVQLNEKVPVTFLPDDPNISTMAEPGWYFYSNLMSVILICLMPAFFIGILAIIQLFRNSQPGTDDTAPVIS